MKKCLYCGSVVNDNEKTCPSCGANEFAHICGNCGTIFESACCPNCGTRAGRKARICPRCGQEYYSNACPNCGYTGRQSSGSTDYTGYHYDNTGRDRYENRYNRSGAEGTGGSWFFGRNPGRTAFYADPSERIRIIFTVLGWIFCWPLMLLITMARARTLSVILKIIFIIFALSMMPMWMRILFLLL